MESLLDKWQGAGRFMHSMRITEIVRFGGHCQSAGRRYQGLRMQTTRPEDYVADPLMHNCVWPVYPGLNPQWEGFASYDFKVPWDLALADQPVKVLSLEGFIDASLEGYGHIDKALVTCPHIENVAYQGLDDWARRATSTVSPKRGREKRNHPYVGLPPRQFWRSAVSDVPAELFDPVDDPPFLINADTKVATAGSCFAQHIALSLKNTGLNYFVAEPPPSDLSLEEAADRRSGLFSARYGNIYTTRQLLQLYDRASGIFEPDDRTWICANGRYVDPFQTDSRTRRLSDERGRRPRARLISRQFAVYSSNLMFWSSPSG